MTEQSTPTPTKELVEAVEARLDAEVHDDLCACPLWPNDCVTYGIRKSWSHSDVEKIIRYAALAAGWKSPAEVAELVRAGAEEAWERSADTVIAYMSKPGFGTVEFVNPYSKPTTNAAKED